MLIECVALYEPALVASFRAVYQSRWTDFPLLEAADLAAHLPPGCALWRAVGGPLALSGIERELSVIDYRLQVLAWQKTKDGQKGVNQPKPPAPIPYAHEADVEAVFAAKQMAARRRRSVT